MSAPAMPNRPLLRYHGGKFRLADWIIGQMPKHAVCGERYAYPAYILGILKDEVNLYFHTRGNSGRLTCTKIIKRGEQTK